MIPVIVGVVAVGAAIIAVVKYSNAKEIEERKLAEQDYANTTNYFKEAASGRLILDTNIWMDEDYGSIFDALEHSLISLNKPLELGSEQFDEIVAIKNLGFEDEKSKRARLALNRIEDFQNKGLLKILNITSSGRRSKHADPAIIEILCKTPIDSGDLLLVTNDRELRIRATQMVRERGHLNFRAIEGKEVLELARKWASSKKIAMKPS